MKNRIIALAVSPIVVAGLTFAPAALAFNFGWPADDGGDTTTVSNHNSAHVNNTVSASAKTGGNSANGANGGSAGAGAKVFASDDNNSGGRGGNGGNGGDGGMIVTGNAHASAGVMNTVNSNRTSVNNCACSGDDDNDETTVQNRNRAHVRNNVDASAKTGWNDANGGNGGSAKDGGAVIFSDDDNTGGAGGNGGAGGWGGSVQTGNASSHSHAVNVVNRNLTRVRN